MRSCGLTMCAVQPCAAKLAAMSAPIVPPPITATVRFSAIEGAPETLAHFSRCLLLSPLSCLLSRRSYTPPAMPPIEVLVIAPLIVLTAYVIFGISGFGSTVIAVPLLAHLLPLKFVIPMIVALDCVGSIAWECGCAPTSTGASSCRCCRSCWSACWRARFLLLRLPAEILLAGLGVFVLAYGLLYVERASTAVFASDAGRRAGGAFRGDDVVDVRRRRADLRHVSHRARRDARADPRDDAGHFHFHDDRAHHRFSRSPGFSPRACSTPARRCCRSWRSACGSAIICISTCRASSSCASSARCSC